MIEDLIRRIILNGSSPAYDEIYQNFGLMLGYLLFTMFIEVVGFGLLYRKMAAKDPKFPLFDMLCWIAALNVITFLIGGAIYLILVSP